MGLRNSSSGQSTERERGCWPLPPLEFATSLAGAAQCLARRGCWHIWVRQSVSQPAYARIHVSCRWIEGILNEQFLSARMEFWVLGANVGFPDLFMTCLFFLTENISCEERAKKNANKPLLDEIVPVYRRDCHEEVYAGSHQYPGRGVYLLKFDNSYSLWRSKSVYYRVYYTR